MCVFTPPPRSPCLYFHSNPPFCRAGVVTPSLRCKPRGARCGDTGHQQVCVYSQTVDPPLIATSPRRGMYRSMSEERKRANTLFPPCPLSRASSSHGAREYLPYNRIPLPRSTLRSAFSYLLSVLHTFLVFRGVFFLPRHAETSVNCWFL